VTNLSNAIKGLRSWSISDALFLNFKGQGSLYITQSQRFHICDQFI